jgi:hypothetical protein
MRVSRTHLFGVSYVIQAGAVKVPKLCNLSDEVALMPCKKESNRDYGLEVEQWREPIRDRDKV